MHELIFILVGLFVGAFGTIIGVGGGFILIPVLLFMFPNDPPEVLTAISLAVVFLNSTSGSVAYALKKRIDFRAGIVFALASVPGAIVGASLVSEVSRKVYEPLFGLLLVIGGILILRKPLRSSQSGELKAESGRHLYDIRFGALISVGVGLISSFLGIGGGIIHVPTLVHLLKFPVQIATATSQFMLVIMSLTGTIVHLTEGTLLPYLDRVLLFGIPAVAGAQLGAYLSKKITDIWIARGLAFALIMVGMRLIFALLK